MEIDSIKPSVIPGYREVAIGGRIVYVSNDGKYLFQGSLIELASRDNLTDGQRGSDFAAADLDACRAIAGSSSRRPIPSTG